MKKIIISAMTKNGVIGFRGRLPWHLPKEYEHFLDSVRGKAMIMGRKSWDVFGGDVDTQMNIVLSRSSKVEHVKNASRLSEAFLLAEEAGVDCFIAGGAEIYKLALEEGEVDEMWLSEVKIELEGDVFFPKFEEADWALKQQEDRGDYIFRRWVKV